MTIKTTLFYRFWSYQIINSGHSSIVAFDIYVSDVKSNDNKTGVQRWEVDSSPSLMSHICTLKKAIKWAVNG